MTVEILNGDYEGYYSYGSSSDSDHKMMASISFEDNGKVSGSGYDDVNIFKFQGTYDLNTMTVSLTKVYPTHSVRYTGVIESNDSHVSISGIWSLKSIINTNGGFTLRKGAINSEVMRDINELEKSLSAAMRKVDGISIELLDL